MADGLDIAEFDHLVGQQAQGPPGMTRGGRTTAQGHQVRLDLAVEELLAGRLTRLAVEHHVEAIVDEALPEAFDRAQADAEALGDAFVGPGRCSRGLIGFEEHEGAADDAGVMRAASREGIEVVAFGVGQFNDVFFMHNQGGEASEEHEFLRRLPNSAFDP